MNRHRTCAGGVWCGTGVQGEGIESGVGVAWHACLLTLGVPVLKLAS